MVTIVDKDAYDEPKYRWAVWCNICDCEVSVKHTGDMSKAGEKGHTLGEKQVIDYYEHYDAVTHDEDQGYYQCSTCGAIQ